MALVAPFLARRLLRRVLVVLLRWRCAYVAALRLAVSVPFFRLRFPRFDLLYEQFKLFVGLAARFRARRIVRVLAPRLLAQMLVADYTAWRLALRSRLLVRAFIRAVRLKFVLAHVLEL